jgi:hypothetical protein
MSDRLELDLEQLPAIVRGLGDRARDADGVLDDARNLASRVRGLGGSSAGTAASVSEAQRQIDRARAGLFDLQHEVAARGEQIALSEGYAEIADAIKEAEKAPKKHHWYDSVTDFASSAWDVIKSNPMDTLHMALDVVGFIPVVGDVADGLNALIYLGQGDWENAALSGIALIPVLGSAATAERLGTRGVKIVKGLREAEEGVEALDHAADAVRAERKVAHALDDADEAVDAIGESRAALNRAEDAREALPKTRKFDQKTVSADGGKTMSGWEEPRPDGYDFATPHEVRDYSKEIGHDLRSSGARDHVGDGGFDGAASASHAEKQMAVAHPNDPLGVSKPMCNDCQQFFQQHARFQGKPQTVTDPLGTWRFPADGGAPTFTPNP